MAISDKYTWQGVENPSDQDLIYTGTYSTNAMYGLSI